MKKTLLIGSAALAIFGLLALRRNKKVKNKVKNKVKSVVREALLTPSALKMLHSAKRAAAKELRAKF